MTLFAALNFGELAAMMPLAGGQYNFVTRIYGRKVGFIYGWSVFSVIQTGVIAAVAMAFAKHLGVLIPSLGEGKYLFVNLFGIPNLSVSCVQFVAILSVLLLSGINARGVQESKWIQRIFTLAKLLALGGLILGAIIAVMILNSPGYLADNMHHYSGALSASLDTNSNISWTSITGPALFLAFSGAMVGSLFSSDAWQGITFMSAEISKPERTIPKALLWGTAIVTVVYCLANLAYFVILPIDTIAGDEHVGVSAARNLLHGFTGDEAGSMAVLLMAALIVISTFGCNNGLILAGSRLYKAMADHGLFFKKATVLNKKGVPGNALWMQAAWASVLCMSGTYGELLKYCTFASLMFYIITVYGVLILRKREPQVERPYRVWGYPFLTIIYLILASAVALGILISQFKVAIYGMAIVLLGWPIYYLFKKNEITASPE
jgi:APA family basic amino acid/polyamine antiporter